MYSNRLTFFEKSDIIWRFFANFSNFRRARPQENRRNFTSVSCGRESSKGVRVTDRIRLLRPVVAIPESRILTNEKKKSKTRLFGSASGRIISRNPVRRSETPVVYRAIISRAETFEDAHDTSGGGGGRCAGRMAKFGVPALRRRRRRSVSIVINS